MSKPLDSLERGNRESWNLLEQAENWGTRTVAERVIEIVVAEILDIGAPGIIGGTELAVVRDMEGKIWAIPETKGIEAGLWSRHEVRPGQRLRLTITQKSTWQTQVEFADSEDIARKQATML